MLIARILFYIVLLIFPYYLFPSGGFQISTAALAAAFMMTLVFGWRSVITGRAVYSHAVFILYAVLVNTSWYFISDNSDFLIYSAFLLVTGMMYFCAVMAGRSMSARDAHLLIVLLFLSVVVQLAIVVTGLGLEGELQARQTAFFNNPNQLAYYVAACSALVLLLAHLFKVRSIFVLMTCLVALSVSVTTASRGGVAACLIYVLLAIFGSSSLKGGVKIFAVIVLSIGVLLSFERFMRTPSFEALNERVENSSDEEIDETAEGRGYDRIILFTDNLAWGNGEGVFERFDTSIELHSYFGTVLFSYGVIGSIFFLWFLRSAIPDWRCFTYLIPLAVYNLTHNGGRSLMLWAVFGLMAAATLPAIGQHAAPMRSKSKKRRRRRSRTGMEV